MKDAVLSSLRHALTFVGAVVAASGWGGASHLETIGGAAIALVGAIWGVYDEWSFARQERARTES